MIRIKSNIELVGQRLAKKLEALKNKDVLLRPIAFDVLDLMTKRIHIDGIAADGGPIGQYSAAYLRRRQRKPYNRTADSKIIVSLTRQLENDWSVIATEKGYGVGFLNSFNLQKARWVEEQKDKKIFSLSKDEQNFVSESLNEKIKEILG